MHEIIFSHFVRQRNIFCTYLDSLNLEKTFCNICVGIFSIFFVQRVPSSFLSTVIIICDGEKHSGDDLYYSKRFVAVFNNLCLTVKNYSNFVTEKNDFRVNFYR